MAEQGKAPGPAADGDGAPLRLHGGSVAFRRADGSWAGVLIRAPSGGGKSAFALRLIALGAQLVADDYVVLRRGEDGRVWASAPPALSGMIEARGLGLLRLPVQAEAPVAWVVDLKMGGAEGRLPPIGQATYFGESIPALTLAEDERAAAALCCLVRDGGLLDPEADLADLKGEADQGGPRA